MRQNNKYLDKIADELTVYQRHLLLGSELTTQQQEVFDKIEIARAWLNNGYSDAQVINVLKNDSAVKVQERRAREILSLAYSVFAELRSNRNKNGLKYIYEESYREKAQKMYDESVKALEFGDREGAAKLMSIYHKLMKEAGIIAGVYEKTSNVDEKKKPTKIIIRRKTNIVNNVVESDELEEFAEFEEEENE
jgi:hypothetical protein